MEGERPPPLSASAPGAEPSATGLDRRGKWYAAGIPGVVLGISAFLLLPLLNLGYLLFAVGAGAVSVVLYRHRTGIREISTGLGAKLGLLTGGIAYALILFITAAWFFVVVVLMRKGQMIMEVWRTQVEAAMERDPALREQGMQQMANDPSMFAVVMVFTLMLLLIVLLVSSAVGGALGARFGSRS